MTEDILMSEPDPKLSEPAMRYSDLSKAFLVSVFLLSAHARAFEPYVNEDHFASSHEQEIGAGSVKKVRAFLDRFVDPEKTPEEQTAFFADYVEYYNQGIVGKSTILHDVKRFVRYWPHRNYRVAEINYINPDPDSDRLFVSYTIEFEVANKAKIIRGRANYGALISALDASPKIESIKERIVERESNAFQLD